MKNFVQLGDTVTLTMPADVSSGDVVVVGDQLGVAIMDGLTGERKPVKTTGVFNLPKATAMTFNEGVILYWDDTNKVVTTSASSNKAIGNAMEAGTNGPTSVLVRLNV